jgi:hypothetical protein
MILAYRRCKLPFALRPFISFVQTGDIIGLAGVGGAAVCRPARLPLMVQLLKAQCAVMAFPPLAVIWGTERGFFFAGTDSSRRRSLISTSEISVSSP